MAPVNTRFETVVDRKPPLDKKVVYSAMGWGNIPVMGTFIHRAGWVVSRPDTVIRDGFVRVENGVITEVGSGRARGGDVVDHGCGALVPAFVNAHTHLELTALAGSVSARAGFRQWVKELLAAREAAGHERLAAGAKEGIDRLAASGVLVVGEVSTLGITADTFVSSPLSGVWFREILGNKTPGDYTALAQDNGVLLSLAAHAPHTTAPGVIREARRLCRKAGRVFSIHLAESDDEVEFIGTGRGEWADFLRERGIDFSSWPIGDRSPVQYLESIGGLDRQTLAVHLIHVDASDMDILAEREVSVCLCPRSNQRLHGRLPDVTRMVDAGINICLGTDSLASVDSLSILDELAFVAYKFQSVPVERLFSMATANGARALGIEESFGTIEPGKCGAIVYIDVKADNSSSLLETIVASGGEAAVRTVGLKNHGKVEER